MVDFDQFYMGAALDEAWRYQLLTYPNPAVGAAVVKNGSLLSIAAHKEAGGPHAEVEAIKEAYYVLTKDREILSLKDSSSLHSYLLAKAKKLFWDATIYVTLEPCNHYGKTPPCSLLIEKLKFKKVVISTYDSNEQAAGGIKRLQRAGIEVVTGVMEEEGEKLIQPFKRWQKDRFIFFKYAQTVNGVVTGGTISSLQSRTFVHKLRNKIDLLVIGGNSVRVDRPTLDSRLVSGRAPDILIYSRHRVFDKTIPLFHIKNRNVYIDNKFDIIEKYKLVMIEGGEGMLRAVENLDLWYLLFIAPEMKESVNYQLKKRFEFVKVTKCDRDLLVWGRDG